MSSAPEVTEEDFGGEIPVTQGTPEDQKLDIEVVDDTPPEDRNRKPSKEPVEEATDDELNEYDEKVQKRFKKLTRGYHDERRAKETAARERDEAVQFAKQAYSRSRQLEQQLADGSQVYISKSVSEAETLLDSAKSEYKAAYEVGDADRVVDAQEKISRAVMMLDQAKRLKPLTVTPEQEYIPQQEVQNPDVAKPDDRTMQWAEDNKWYGKNIRMTALVHGIHAELAEEGIDPRTDPEEYFQHIDAGMRDAFPQYFKTGSDQTRENNPPRAKPTTVVAPATRSSAPKKVVLTSTQVALARKLNIPIEAYAREVARLQSEQARG